MLASLVNKQQNMAKKGTKTFVANDENVVNSYGFRVRNAGLKFERFDNNPVMLDSHQNMTGSVLGNWQNRRIEGSQLLMDSNFDLEDAETDRIAGKVERGFVKACSLGLFINFDEASWERQPDGIWDLILAEVMENTVCAVPSNSSALTLYNKATGELIAEDQIKLSVQNLSANNVQTQISKMEKVILSSAAIAVLVGLSVTNSENVAEISNAIVKLNSDKTAAENKVVELQGKLDAQNKSNAKALADQALLDGKITQPEHEELMNDAIANFALTSKLVARMPAKVSLTGQVNNTTTLQLAADKMPKNLDEFEKLTGEEKLSFKTEHPDKYEELFA